MQKLTTSLNSQIIKIYVGSNLKNLILKTLTNTKGKNIFIVSRSVYPICKEYIDAMSLKDPIIVNSKDNHKDLTSFEFILKQCYDRSLNRKSRIIGIGGGTMGDYIGFLASVYMRGVEFVYIPTTLMSQCDPVINKVALNANGVKNLIGNFYSPSYIFCDTDFITALPESAINEGMSEIVKHALIKPTKLLDILIHYSEKEVQRTEYDWEQLVYESIKVKLWFVKRDFFDDQGIHVGLNYGHTFAHALEEYSKYSYSHGHAVAIGLKLAGSISNQLHVLDNNSLSLQDKLLSLTHFNLFLPNNLDTDKFIRLLKRDKHSENNINLILLKNSGKYIVYKHIDSHLIANIIDRNKST